MRRTGILVLAFALLAATTACERLGLGGQSATAQPGSGAPGPGGAGGPGAPGGPGGPRNFGRMPMTVELITPTRAAIEDQLTVVGNLVGDATVAVVPRTAGRLDAVYVRLGDPVTRGQRIGKIEDREFIEQVKQAEASFEVGNATVRQREADLKFAQTNLERSKSLYERQLLPRQSLDDAEARSQAAIAQLDLARAQVMQNKARLEELRVILANTLIVSPVDGFVARRAADAGAYASPNAPIVDVVDINRVRLVANVVEKDLRRVREGQSAHVQVDAYPGEEFRGRVARVAPVLDPTTRTAQIEVEIPNPGHRLKPGMYARISVTTDIRSNALVVPRNAVVDMDGRRGVFVTEDNQVAHFRPIEVGIENADRLEIASGVTEQDKVVTTGAAALRDGDRILLAGAAGSQGGPGGRGPGAAARGAAGTGGPGGGAPPGGRGSPGGERRIPGA
ncbi:MAG: efflux RND transporter periplasmic adaptor subunit [Vicinamibacterales bacterium]